jgi:hypothetical protein
MFKTLKEGLKEKAKRDVYIYIYIYIDTYIYISHNPKPKQRKDLFSYFSKSSYIIKLQNLTI